MPNKDKRKCIVKNSNGKECGIKISVKNPTNLKTHICKLHLEIYAELEKSEEIRQAKKTEKE